MYVRPVRTPGRRCHTTIITLPPVAPSAKVKVKVSTLDIAPLRGTPPQKRSGTDHTVLPANFTVPASTS